jgi:predicted sulfurtransferase
MAKVSGKFTNLPRSQQANFADLIAKKKEKLVGLLVAQSRKTTESTGKPLSARDMQELLAKAVADE